MGGAHAKGETVKYEIRIQVVESVFTPGIGKWGDNVIGEWSTVSFENPADAITFGQEMRMLAERRFFAKKEKKG
jgi:hypothetical protein